MDAPASRGASSPLASAGMPASCPAMLDAESCPHTVKLCAARRTALYTHRGNHADDVGTVRAESPVPRGLDMYYYEVMVLDRGRNNRITVGFATDALPPNRPVGEGRSYAYESGTGRRVSGGEGSPFGSTFETDAVVGAGIDFYTRSIFFTRNGRLVGTAFHNVPVFPGVRPPAAAGEEGEEEGGPTSHLLRDVRPTLLRPAVSLHSGNEHVCFNFGRDDRWPFVFDLAAARRTAAAAMQERVARTPFDARVLPPLIRSHLVFSGYSATLAAFDRATGGGQLPKKSRPPGGGEPMRVDDEARLSAPASPRSSPAASSSTSKDSTSRVKRAFDAALAAAESTVHLRRAMRESALAGDVQHAAALLDALVFRADMGALDVVGEAEALSAVASAVATAGYVPFLLRSEHAPLCFVLAAQSFVELVRARCDDAALDMARSDLAPLATHATATHMQALRSRSYGQSGLARTSLQVATRLSAQVAADDAGAAAADPRMYARAVATLMVLLAYGTGDGADATGTPSNVRALLTLDRRAALAEALNVVALAAHGLTPSSPLDTLLRQLVLVHRIEAHSSPPLVRGVL